MIEVFRYSSDIPGPNVLILGAIHGNEKCGSFALKKFLKLLDDAQLTLQKGSVCLVPICNPLAFEQNKRFVEENLNRVILPTKNPQTYEAKLANQICPLIEAADYLLDLHSMQAKGQPFSMLNKMTKESESFCRSLGAPAMVSGWVEVFARHPQVPATCTQTYADRFNIPNALIECGSHEDPSSADVAFGAIMSALSHLEVLDSAEIQKLGFQILKGESKKVHLEEIVFRQSLEDKFVKEWKSFEVIKKNEPVAIRKNGEAVLASRDGVIVFPNPLSPVGVEWFFEASVSADE